MTSQKKSGDRWEDLYWQPHNYNERRKIKSGSYLRSYCPHCKFKLTKESIIRLEVVTPEDEIGEVGISAYLNVFERKTSMRLKKGQEVKDLRCPECHHTLITERECGTCQSKAAMFLIGVSNARVPFYICTKVGCHWHALSPEDEKRIILDDSDEW